MEHLTITKPDGSRLQGLFSAPAAYRYLVIICHGFSGAKENSGHLFPFTEKLNAAGYAVLACDFLGSGESDGTFSSITLSRQIDDLQCIMAYATEHFQVPLLLLGRSFGGSTVIGVGADPAVAGCILWSAAIDLEAVFRKGFGEYYALMEQGETIHAKIINSDIVMEPGFVQDLKQQDMDTYIKALSTKPILSIQGLNDALVDPRNVERIREFCPEAEIHLIENADHRFENLKELRENLTLDWLRRNFG